MCWTVFGDPSRPDDFYEAAAHLFQNLDRSPSSGSGECPPFALDVDARIADLRSTDKFEKIENQMFRTSEIFRTAKLLELHATFSEISRLDPTERNRLLERLAEIADKQFNGRVEKPIITSIYIAQRKPIYAHHAVVIGANVPDTNIVHHDKDDIGLVVGCLGDSRSGGGGRGFIVLPCEILVSFAPFSGGLAEGRL
jgi:hypothetical protein